MTIITLMLKVSSQIAKVETLFSIQAQLLIERGTIENVFILCKMISNLVVSFMKKSTMYLPVIFYLQYYCSNKKVMQKVLLTRYLFPSELWIGH